MFDAMLHGRVDTEGLQFATVIADVEQLNNKAFKAELDISKVSYHAYLYLRDQYNLLDSGSALGKGCGPLLITTPDIFSSLQFTIYNLQSIAIPGRYTTANLLLSLYAPEAVNKKEYLFSEIEDAILKGEVDAGLIIHENRFTYEQKGLVKIIDLGEYWESTTGLPIPLGGIVVRKSFSDAKQQKINRVLKRSIEYALANPAASRAFVKQHAQSMEDDVIQQHIDLYVNHYSISLGEEGRKAVDILFEKSRLRERNALSR